MVGKYSAACVAESSWESILESPEFFLHSINPRENVLEFVRTSRDILSQTSFLDGRVELNRDPNVYRLPLDEVVSWQGPSNVLQEPNRYLFHMSFCGSTLVSRVFDKPGTVMCYREPQVLLQLAEIKAANTSLYRSKQQWTALVSFVLQQYRQQWQCGEKVILKPSNWLNSSLPQLLKDGGNSRAAYLGLTPMAFLVAVFRGGGERIQFSYSVLRHLLHSFPEYTKWVDEVENQSLDTVNQFARLVLILHAVQVHAFERAALLSGDAVSTFCDYQSLLKSPTAEIAKLAEHLGVSLQQHEIDAQVRTTFAKHSKVNHRAYNAEQAVDVDQQVISTYGTQFESAMQWANERFGKQRESCAQ